MHPSLQHAVLSVLQASLDSTQGAASTPHATAEQLASLLQLPQLGGSSSAISELAYKAAQSYLEQTVGFDNLAEVHLWLDSLPRMATIQDSARYELRGTTQCPYSLHALLASPLKLLVARSSTCNSVSSKSASVDISRTCECR